MECTLGCSKNKFLRGNRGSLRLGKEGRVPVSFLPYWILSKSGYRFFFHPHHAKHSVFGNSNTGQQSVVWELTSKHTAPLTHNMLHIFISTHPYRSSLAFHVSLRRWQGVLVNKLLGLFSIPLQCSFSEVENTHACAHMHTKLCQRWSTSKCHLNAIKRILGLIGLITQDARPNCLLRLWSKRRKHLSKKWLVAVEVNSLLSFYKNTCWIYHFKTEM